MNLPRLTPLLVAVALPLSMAAPSLGVAACTAFNDATLDEAAGAAGEGGEGGEGGGGDAGGASDGGNAGGGGVGGSGGAVAGAGGAAGQAGKAGQAGQAGQAGKAGQAGQAGQTGQAGKAGQAGQAGQGPAGGSGGNQAGASGSGASAGGGTAGAGGAGACDPIKQTGCTAPLSKCGLLSSGQMGCQTPGGNVNQQPCTKTEMGDSCVAGQYCLVASLECEAICDPKASPTGCPAGQPCTTLVTPVGGPSFYVCTPPSKECDVMLQNCPGTTKACYFTQMGEQCLEPSMVVADGQPCPMANNCAKGSVCLKMTDAQPLTCRKLCNYGNAEPGCGPAEKCEPVNNGPAGVCIPL